MDTPVISLRDVWKIYKLGNVDVNALRGASLDIYRGSFVAIMGPSGSGKSTLLNMVGLLDVPSKGQIFIDGKDTANFTENEIATTRGKTIGFIFQQFNLLQNLTALENVMIPMIFQGVSEEERKERATHLLDLVDLEDRMHHLPSELSGGQRQRVAIARAFANNPEVVIADEPTGNLDSKSGKLIMEMLTRFHKEEKGTLIVVTHDPNIADYTETEICIEDGQIVEADKESKEVLWKH
jgi:putative ABC transport system ATP-binding protein